ncbi:MAG: two-component regulator propeller domain-containing protein, partial [Bacteroidota bacterium]
IATWGGGLSCYDRSTDKFVNYLHDPRRSTSVGSNLLRSVYVDSRGTLWVGTYDAGVNRFDSEQQRFERIVNIAGNPQSLPHDEVQSIFEDNTGTLWIGTASGVAHYDRKREKFPLMIARPGVRGSVPQHSTRCLHVDRQGGLWAGTMGGGLSYLASGSPRFVQYQHDRTNPGSISSDLIVCVYEQSNGDIWVGTRGGGLNRLDRKTHRFTRYRNDPRNPHSLSLDDVASICETHDGSLWVGTNGGGLERFDSKTQRFIHYRYQPGDTTSISGNSIWSLHEDSKGNLWAGTWGADLCRFDRSKNQFIRYRHSPRDPATISGNTVVCMAEDQLGNIWVGTTDGLSRYDYASNRFTRYSEKDGLSNNSVSGVVVDRKNNVWVSTNKGLSRLDPRTGSFRNYDVSYGLQGDEFDQGAYAKGRDGTLYFGGLGGINAFDPDSIVDNPFVPPVVITSLKVLESPMRFSQNSITLSHEENYFSFEYAALSYTAPHKNRYAYTLKGFDRDWINAETRRYASYTHLDPGEYVFRVKGTNNDGVWNEEGAAVHITIIPPYWKTWWFRVLAVAMMGGIAFSFFRYRLNKLLEVERTRNRIARDLHDEVSATLSGINYFARAISSDSGNKVTPGSQKFLALIHESATEVQESMSDIIWSINPENDDWERVLAKLRRYASDLFDSKAIRYSIKMPPVVPSKPLAMERRRHFWLIYKEMGTN